MIIASAVSCVTGVTTKFSGASVRKLRDFYGVSPADPRARGQWDAETAPTLR